MEKVSMCVLMCVVFFFAWFVLERANINDEVLNAVAKCTEAKAQVDGFIGSPQEVWNKYALLCK